MVPRRTFIPKTPVIAVPTPACRESLAKSSLSLSRPAMIDFLAAVRVVYEHFRRAPASDEESMVRLVERHWEIRFRAHD